MLDARTGAVLHTARMEHSPRAVAVDDRTGRVFVLSRGIDDAYVPPMGMSGTVSALTVERWTAPTPRFVSPAPVGVAPSRTGAGAPGTAINASTIPSVS
jgi:hypothetical protein